MTTEKLTSDNCILYSTLQYYVKRSLFKVTIPFNGLSEAEIYEDTEGALWCKTYDVPAKHERTENSYIITHYCRRYDHERETSDNHCLVDSAAFDRLLKTHAISLNR